MIRFAWFVVMTAGCSGPSPNAYLADLPELRVHTYASYPHWSFADTLPVLTVHLDYGPETFDQTNDGMCATLHDVRGTYNGTELELTEPGQEDDFDCVHPIFETKVPLGVDEPGELVIEDGSLAIRATFAAGTINARRAWTVSHEDWTFTPGDRVTVAWSHVQDFAGELEVTLPDAYDDPTRLDTEHVSGTDELSFTIPDVTPTYEIGFITITAADTNDFLRMGTATECSGAAACTWSQSLTFRHYIHFTEHLR